MIDYNKFVDNSRKWLKNYIWKNHLESVCIGVSGGIDSTISCAIVSRACRDIGIPFIGRSLPTSTNKPEENQIANLVGKAFCTDFKIVSISGACKKIIDEMELIEGELSDLQKGNIKARYRMMYLRNLASIHKGVVLDNDNFTEWNTGFWTVGGDSPGDINLGLHYLWKTEVFELGHVILNNLREKFEERDLDDPKYIEYKERFNAISASLRLTPTDGNGVSKSDCEQFGLENYGQVDDVLKTMYYSTNIKIGSTERINEYIRLIDSYNEQGVDKVMLLHQNTEYKRKPAPIMPAREELGL